MALSFEITRNPAPKSQAELNHIWADPGFGNYFTDHMVTIPYDKGQGWHDARIHPYGPITLQPHAAVLHYGQEIFEGLKAYRHPDGTVWLFQPERNAERFAKSAQRLMLPELPVADFVAAVVELVRIDSGWVPSAEGGEFSLYIRPFMYASEPFLGVRAAESVTFNVIASPVGPYFTGGVKPVDIWVTRKYSRAGKGGTGAAKCGGNYASSLIAQYEGYEYGCSQVLFADAATGTQLEELGGMNVFVVTRDHQLVTPELSGSILDGVTRRAILTVAGDVGLTPVERRFGVAELYEGIESGEFVEAFACGTAAVITPIGSFKDEEGDHSLGGGDIPATLAIRQAILDIQYGRAEDSYGWMHQVV